MARKTSSGNGTEPKSSDQTTEASPTPTESHLQRPGRGWHGDPEKHAEAGRKGGNVVSQNRQHMAEIGKKGGSKVAQNRQHMAEIGKKGGSKVAQDRQHMAEIGKKGGESR